VAFLLYFAAFGFLLSDGVLGFVLGKACVVCKLRFLLDWFTRVLTKRGWNRGNNRRLYSSDMHRSEAYYSIYTVGRDRIKSC
jgi:hypothetical protein